jgi:hypothetical protein
MVLIALNLKLMADLSSATMAAIRNPFYVLTIRRKGQTDGTFTYYTQGICANNMNLRDVAHWTISRMSFQPPAKKEVVLNQHFIAFQRLWRAYRRLLRVVRNPRRIREREAGLFDFRRLVWPPPIGTLYAAAVSTSRATDVA